MAIKAIILSSMLLVGAASVHAQTPLGDLVSEVKRATVVVTSYDINGKNLGQASGFLIAPDRVLTNVRFIDSARLIRIYTFSGKTISVENVVAKYVDASVVILHIKEACLDVAPLKVKTISQDKGAGIVLDNSEETEWRVMPAFDGGWNFEHIATHLQVTASLDTNGGGPVIKLKAHVEGTAVTIP